MNRQGIFTMRGIKDGVSEMDLVGVAQNKQGVIEGFHIECQVSFRPVSYVTPLTEEYSKQYGKAKTSAWKRPPEVVRDCVIAWIEKKFDHKDKKKVRESLWPGITWQKILVHGVIKNSDEEIELSRRLRMVSFHEVLRDTCFRAHGGYPGAVGADLVDIVTYFEAVQSSINQK